MSLLEKLKAGKRNVRIVKFPGTDGDVGIRVLSNQEIQDAVFAAERFFDKAEIAIRTSTLDAYEDERSTQILWRALREPEEPEKPFADTVGAFRGLTSRAEKEALVRLYDEFQEECSPDFRAMADGDFEELFEALKKNAQILSSVSSLPMLKGLLRYSASLHATSPQDNG